MTARCPHCQSEFEVPKGALYSLSDQSTGEKEPEEKKEPPKFPVRGKAREYSKAFEIAWKTYPIKAQKFEAYGIWRKVTKEIPEDELLPLIMHALVWQKKGWLRDADWYKPPYFERYLKRRKWEDEPSQADAVPRPIDRSAEATDKKIAELRRYAKPDPRIAEEIRALAESKAVSRG